MKQLAFVLLALCCAALPAAAASPVTDYDAQLVALAKSYQTESFLESPSSATDAGIHTYDAQLADFSAQAQADQFAKLLDFRTRLVALQPPAGASAHDRVDYLLMRSRTRRRLVETAVLRGLQRNPTVYEGECTNGIFSLIKKREYASDEIRTRDAIARMRACPRVLAEGKANLTDTVREFAQIGVGRHSRRRLALHDDARRTGARRRPATRADLRAAQKTALDALHAYRRVARRANMASFHEGGFSVGQEQYEWYLHGACCCCRSIRTTSPKSAASSWRAIARSRCGKPIATRTNRRRRRRRPLRRRPRSSHRTTSARLAKLIAFINSHEIVTSRRTSGRSTSSKFRKRSRRRIRAAS